MAPVGVLWGPQGPDRPESGPGFDRWYSALPVQSMTDVQATRPITLIEFVDYQCPACKARAMDYHEVLARASAELGDSFQHLRLDFPLDTECNSRGVNANGGPLHEAACEASAAVRLARRQGVAKEEAVVKWLWDHQTSLTSDAVFAHMEVVEGLSLRSNYENLLEEVSRDVAVGRQLRVAATPAYFLNGRRLPPLSAVSLETALSYERRMLGLGHAVPR